MDAGGRERVTKRLDESFQQSWRLHKIPVSAEADACLPAYKVSPHISVLFSSQCVRTSDGTREHVAFLNNGSNLSVCTMAVSFELARPALLGMPCDLFSSTFPRQGKSATSSAGPCPRAFARIRPLRLYPRRSGQLWRQSRKRQEMMGTSTRRRLRLRPR